VTIGELLGSFFMRSACVHARRCREAREYTPGHASLTCHRIPFPQRFGQLQGKNLFDTRAIAHVR
jgi:hypothetical protein